jgi:hypothetical protein
MCIYSEKDPFLWGSQQKPFLDLCITPDIDLQNDARPYGRLQTGIRTEETARDYKPDEKERESDDEEARALPTHHDDRLPFG